MSAVLSSASDEIDFLSDRASEIYLRLEGVEKLQFRTIYRRELKRVEIFARNSAVDIHAMGTGRIQKNLMGNVDAIHDLICKELSDGSVCEKDKSFPKMEGSLDEMIEDGKERLEFYAEQICEIMEKCIEKTQLLNERNAVIMKNVESEVRLLYSKFDEMMSALKERAYAENTEDIDNPASWLKSLKTEYEDLRKSFLDFMIRQYSISLKKCIVSEFGEEGVPRYIRDHAFECRPVQPGNFIMVPLDWWKTHTADSVKNVDERRAAIDELCVLYREQMDEQIIKVEHRYTRIRQSSYENEMGNYNVVQDTCRSLKHKLADRYHFEYDPEPLEKLIER